MASTSSLFRTSVSICIKLSPAFPVWICNALRAEDSVLCCGDDATRETTENRRSTLYTVSDVT